MKTIPYRMRAALPASLICLGLILSACSRSTETISSDGPFELRIEQGSARVSHDRQARSTSETTEISPGDRVQLEEGGRGILQVTGGSRVELDAAAVRVDSASRLTLEKGRMLINAQGPLTVTIGRVLASTSGPAVFRVDKDLATRVGVYSGTSVRAGRAGETVSIPPFHQIVVAGGVVPRASKPLKFSGQDRWDERFLAAALDLDSRLTDIARGLEAQLGSAGGLEFFQTTAGGQIPVDFLTPFLGSRRADLLIGLLMAFEADPGNPAGFAERFNQVFSFWSDGATWGLVARTFDVKGESLFARLRDAIDRSKINVIGPGPGLQQKARTSKAAVATPGPSGASSAPQPTPSAGASPSSSSGLVLPQVGVQLPPQLLAIINGLLGVP